MPNGATHVHVEELANTVRRVPFITHGIPRKRDMTHKKGTALKRSLCGSVAVIV